MTTKATQYDRPVLTQKALAIVNRDKLKQEQAIKDYGLDGPATVFFSYTDSSTHYIPAGGAFISCQNYSGNNEY